MPELGHVLLMSAIDRGSLLTIFSPYGLALQQVEDRVSIPGTFWGEPEAGLIGSTLYYRNDTPVHSVLHEGCHFVCMPLERRQTLHTNAGNNQDEENAVCYLQILLTEKIPELSAERIMADMDAWGYSFRLGSARAWFEQDADDAQLWLQQKGLITM